MTGGWRSIRISSTVLTSLVLIAMTVGVFWQIRNHGFVGYDDNSYVLDNPHVRAGLTREGVFWAFTDRTIGLWHPLTWLSLMLDSELYGLNPGPRHLMNLFFHVASTVLLFLVFLKMTGARWRSAFVAALFALHPLHVESVAWISERKDVLSGFFWILSMWAYVLYVEKRGVFRYGVTLILFVLALLSKPMVVTLPFVFLLLDYWPLSRFEKHREISALRVILEKAPFFFLAVIAAFLTFFHQRTAGTVAPIEVLPLSTRLANSMVSYTGYLSKMFWPDKLTVFYPYSANLPAWKTALSWLFILGTSLLIIRALKKMPWLFVGWFWYLGTLLPVIGLVQVGQQSMADRYTYLPLIGLFIVIAWSVPAKPKVFHTVFVLGAGLALLCLSVTSSIQIRYWRDGITLFEHALEVTTDNVLAHNNLANALAREGKSQDAIVHYTEALRINPKAEDVHNNLAVILAQQGKLEEAIAQYTDALSIKPDYAEAHNGLGYAFATQGKISEAIAQYAVALRLKPDFQLAHINLGVALASQGRNQEAIDQFTQVLQIEPRNAEAHYDIGVALLREGKNQEARERCRIVLSLNPVMAQKLCKKTGS
jgi:Flp pilus assembly protein TadD